MWEPPYGREGYPVTADDPSPLSPQGQFESEMRFIAGLRGSRYQRRAARVLVIGLVVVVGAFVLGAVLFAVL